MYRSSAASTARRRVSAAVARACLTTRNAPRRHPRRRRTGAVRRCRPGGACRDRLLLRSGRCHAAVAPGPGGVVGRVECDKQCSERARARRHLVAGAHGAEIGVRFLMAPARGRTREPAGGCGGRSAARERRAAHRPLRRQRAGLAHGAGGLHLRRRGRGRRASAAARQAPQRRGSADSETCAPEAAASRRTTRAAAPAAQTHRRPPGRRAWRGTKPRERMVRQKSARASVVRDNGLRLSLQGRSRLDQEGELVFNSLVCIAPTRAASVPPARVRAHLPAAASLAACSSSHRMAVTPRG